jgi:hypothetical protein
MRLMFSVVGLLVVLVIVGVQARKQLIAVKAVAPASSDAASADVREQSQQMQQRVQQDVQRALEQGAARASDAAQ